MITLVTGALIGIRSITQRNQKLLALHDDAAAINRMLQADAGGTLHGAKWEATADPGTDGVWGSGDEVLTLTWMTALSDPKQLTYEFGRDARHDLIWCRMRWIGGGSDQPARLMYTRNTGFRTRSYRPASGGSIHIHMDPLPRRDRRRDLNDNDLRYVPGLQPVEYAAIAMPGDGADLDQALLPMHSPNVVVEDMRIAWVDRGGWRTVLTADGGIAQYDANDGTQALTGGPWDNSQRLALDGVFLDARSHTAPGMTRPVSTTRPVLLQVSFTLRELGATPSGTSEPVRLRVDLSLPTAPELAAP